ncbi:unnamed protein product, partial [Ascophyllum nodosum]
PQFIFPFGRSGAADCINAGCVLFPSRSGPLARRDPRWTLREVYPESSTLVRFKSRHTSRHSRATY